MDFKEFYDSVVFDVDSSLVKIFRGKKGDAKSRGLYVTIAQKNVTVEDLTDLSLMFIFEKPDKTSGIINAVLDEDDDTKFRVDFSNQVFAVPGVVKAELRLLGPDEEVISIKQFKIMVDDSIADGSIVSENERGILDRAFELAEDLIPRIELLDVELLEDVQSRQQSLETEVGANASAISGIQDDLSSHMTDYATQHAEQQLKISKVEKDINDYQKAMQNININQEATQKINGFGIISLPKNVANGQFISANVLGNSDGIKSTIPAGGRLTVKDSSGVVKGEVYIPAKEGGYRSLPNGTKDEFSAVTGEQTQRIKQYVLQASDVFGMNTSYTELDFARINKPSDSAMYGQFASSDNTAVLDQYPALTGVIDYNSSDMLGKASFKAESTRFWVGFSKDTTLEQAKIALAGTTLTYQLAVPVVTQVSQPQSLISYPSGTVYAEPIIADAGLYTDKMTILNTDAPIKRLDRLSVVDFLTGVETQLDVSQAVIAVDELSFTHPEIEEGAIVFFEYEYEYDGTQPEIEAEYYDSRYVLKDSVTGKYYKVVPTVANGVLTNGLVEV